jgi:hypothetical protein
METLRKKERGDKTQFTAKLVGNRSLGPSYFVLSNFHSQLRIWSSIMPKLAVLTPWWSLHFMDNFLM